MTRTRQEDCGNTLLARVAAEDFERLAPDLACVALPTGFLMASPGEVMDHAYFPRSGVGSIITISPSGRAIETGLFGRDGMAPIALLMGVSISVQQVVIQVPGEVWCIAKAPLLESLERSAPFRHLLGRYAYAVNVQTSFAAVTNAVSPITVRLARWLLMYNDRLSVPTIELTHETIAILLGVRRPSVTSALHVLEGLGFLRASRGRITLIERDELERFACDVYGTPESVYRQVLQTSS